MADGLPLVVEVVDVPDRVDAFLAQVHEVLPGALVTRESVRIVAPDGT